MQVAVIMGSSSDKELMRPAVKALDELGLSWDAVVLSAHRTPEELEGYLKKVEADGCRVIIAGAGLAAHLPGVIASKSLLPVIGVPLKAANSAMEGMDAVLSIVQMPPGVPVATVGINNSTNAAVLAARIIALEDEKVEDSLKHYMAVRRDKLLKQAEEGIFL
jgi:5-(carboxyamino)imidazole ribonucleotide mutase